MHSEIITHINDPVRKVKLDAPEFDNRLESTTFLNWLDKMNEYFEWYMSDAQRIGNLVWLGLS